MNNSKIRNLSLHNTETEFGTVSARESILIAQILYKWVRNNGREFSCTRAELAHHALDCHPQYVTDMLNKYNQLFYRRYVHTGRGENRRTHLHIDVNIVECCMAFGERIYTLLKGRLLEFLRGKTVAIFRALAQVLSLPKKTQEDDLNTNKLGDVSVSDCASPSTKSITPDLTCVERERDCPMRNKEDETGVFAPALCGERANAVSIAEFIPHTSKIRKYNTSYANVLAALEEKKRLNIPSPGSLERIKEAVKNKMDLNRGLDIEMAPAREIHPLRPLLNKRLGFS